MRSKKEIIKDIENKVGNSVSSVCFCLLYIGEILLDIRDKMGKFND